MIGTYSNLFGIYYYAPSSILKESEREITLFIHGAGGSHKHWKYIIDKLSTKIYSICIDLPGHGNSPGYVSDTMEKLIIKLEQFIDDIGVTKPISIVGHSCGGLIAQAFAIKNQSLINKIVFISSAPTIRLHPQLLVQLSSGCLDVDFLCNGFMSGISNSQKWLLINDLALTRLKKDSKDFMDVSKLNYFEELRNIDRPTLILHGQQDKVVSVRRIKRMSQLLSNSSIRMIEGAGHYPHLEQPNKIITYLNRFLIN